jgi:hypothetical protein
MANQLRQLGADPQAKVLERCASQLQEALQEQEGELLTLTEASKESGYSADHLGRLIKDGKIPNAGRKGAPRIRRGDLPIKPGALTSDPPALELSRTQIVRSVANQEEASDG